MKKILFALGVVSLGMCAVQFTPSETSDISRTPASIPGVTDTQNSGCCSWHNGVCGYYFGHARCCDDTIRLRAERAALSNQLEAAKVQASAKSRENVASIIELATSAKSLFKTRNALEKRDFLEKIVSNPRLKGATIEYNIQKAWGVLIELRGKWEVVVPPRIELGTKL